jgi:enoyl-CoA hydratase/carnithine racemase
VTESARLLTIEVDCASSVAGTTTVLVGLLRQLERSDGQIVTLVGRGAGLVSVGPVDGLDNRRLLATVCDLIAAHPMPVLCATVGALTDASLDIALACDLRFALPNAPVGFPAARRGELPVGGITRLVDAASPAVATRLVLLGALLSGETDRALESFLLFSDDPVRAALNSAAELVEAAPLVLEALKTSLRMSGLPLSVGVAVEADLAALLLPTADREAGVRAQLAHRRPEFRGE